MHNGIWIEWLGICYVYVYLTNLVGQFRYSGVYAYAFGDEYFHALLERPYSKNLQNNFQKA